MESNQKLRLRTRQGRTFDSKEKNRILQQYAGIFKHNIPEYAETLKKNKPQKNYAR